MVIKLKMELNAISTLEVITILRTETPIMKLFTITISSTYRWKLFKPLLDVDHSSKLMSVTLLSNKSS
jgi:hypothetical protein